MKKAFIVLISSIAWISSSLARDDYALGQIKTNFPITPQISFSGAPSKPFTPQTWLEVEVEFKSNIEFTEELTFKYYVTLDGKKCLTGTVNHINILRGNSLFSVMYVTPGSLNLVSGGKFGRNVQEVTVQVLSKGQVVAQKSMKNTQGDWWTRVEATPGILLNKNQTPFAFVHSL